MNEQLHIVGNINQPGALIGLVSAAFPAVQSIDKAAGKALNATGQEVPDASAYLLRLMAEAKP